MKSFEKAMLWLRESRPRLGLGLIVVASLLTWCVAFCGPTVMTLQLGPRHGSVLPPWYLPTALFFLDDRSATVLLWLAVILGALGLSFCLHAINQGWLPKIKLLVKFGVGLHIVTALVPPVTSADVLMYAAYGRLQSKGIDPYSVTPAEIYRMQYDEVMRWLERPWTDTPSVYGPIAGFTQWLANVLGGTSIHDIVFWLQFFCVVPLIVIGLIAVSLTRGDSKAQTRALLLTLLNPLMIWAVVAGAHNEALGVCFAMAALTQVRRRPLVAGLWIGLAGGVKVSLVFYGIALLWAYRRSWVAAIQFCVGAVIPVACCYAVHPQALFAARRNTGYISTGSWANGVWIALNQLLGDSLTRTFITIISLVMMVAVAWILWRVLPWRAVVGCATGARYDVLTDASRMAVVLCTAWLVTSPYTLSWYDLITWAPLALLAASRLDYVMIWRGVWLSVAFVTGRALAYPSDIAWISRMVQGGSTIAQYGVLVAIFWWGYSIRKDRVSRATRG
ncbi:MAG: glycosyltransferase family 87 protein [Propionibacteriaceae bacterium]